MTDFIEKSQGNNDSNVERSIKAKMSNGYKKQPFDTSFYISTVNLNPITKQTKKILQQQKSREKNNNTFLFVASETSRLNMNIFIRNHFTDFINSLYRITS